MRDLKGMLKAKFGLRPVLPRSLHSTDGTTGALQHPDADLKGSSAGPNAAAVSASSTTATNARPRPRQGGRGHNGDTQSLRGDGDGDGAEADAEADSETETFGVGGDSGALGHSNAALHAHAHAHAPGEPRQARLPHRTSSSSRNVSAATPHTSTFASAQHNNKDEQQQRRPETSPAQRDTTHLPTSASTFTRTAASSALANANLQHRHQLEPLQTQTQTNAAHDDFALHDANDSDAGRKSGDGDWTPSVVLTPTSSTTRHRPAELIRRQSLLPSQDAQHIIHALLDGETTDGNSAQPSESAASIHTHLTDQIRPGSGNPSFVEAAMKDTRKIWVKRPGSSATLVQIREDDLVDDVRDMILRKYANSLGRNFDAPDVSLKIVPRELRNERLLGPEEPMARTLDAVFPGGQSVLEALIIDVPVRRTPRPSPRAMYYHADDVRPSETGDDYFPPMPVTLVPSPHHPAHSNINAPPSAVSSIHAPHSMSVVSTGYVPALPSPGANPRRYGGSRPRVARVPTTSPSVGNGHQSPTSVIQGTPLENSFQPQLSRSRTHAVAADPSSGPTPPIAPPLPATPPHDETATSALGLQGLQPVHMPPLAEISTPTSIPGPKPRKSKKLFSRPSMPTGMLNGAAVPPINVLIVEDNIINLKLLEAFMKRLKVRWQTAMNGKEAMTKWRSGGFHLVLMDIQLPVMNGLEATREIRRLEKANGIGVFSSSASSKAPELKRGEGEGELKEEDRLGGREGEGWGTSGFFKSPVIIVALTASSLQSDRHEALAAGCNDFLTKPVNFVWLERKVMEWGCMQALIDFDGWRKWKDFSANEGAQQDKKDTGKKKGLGLLAGSKKKRMSAGREIMNGANGGVNERGATIKEESESV